MATYISILRGINVSGSNIIKMDALKKMCAALKLEHVHTYIQSGNIIFNYKNTATEELSSLIKKAIHKTFGYDVPVLTLMDKELENIITANPFTKDKTNDAQFFHVTFLAETPEKEKASLLEQVLLKNDAYKIIGKAIYLYCPDGYSATKLTNNFIENKLNVQATTRNWKTTNELLSIAHKIKK